MTTTRKPKYSRPRASSIRREAASLGIDGAATRPVADVYADLNHELQRRFYLMK